MNDKFVKKWDKYIETNFPSLEFYLESNEMGVTSAYPSLIFAKSYFKDRFYNFLREYLSDYPYFGFETYGKYIVIYPKLFLGEVKYRISLVIDVSKREATIYKEYVSSEEKFKLILRNLLSGVRLGNLDISNKLKKLVSNFLSHEITERKDTKGRFIVEDSFSDIRKKLDSLLIRKVEHNFHEVFYGKLFHDYLYKDVVYDVIDNTLYKKYAGIEVSIFSLKFMDIFVDSGVYDYLLHQIYFLGTSQKIANNVRELLSQKGDSVGSFFKGLEVVIVNLGFYAIYYYFHEAIVNIVKHDFKHIIRIPDKIRFINGFLGEDVIIGDRIPKEQLTSLISFGKKIHTVISRFLTKSIDSDVNEFFSGDTLDDLNHQLQILVDEFWNSGVIFEDIFVKYGQSVLSSVNQQLKGIKQKISGGISFSSVDAKKILYVVNNYLSSVEFLMGKNLNEYNFFIDFLGFVSNELLSIGFFGENTDNSDTYYLSLVYRITGGKLTDVKVDINNSFFDDFLEKIKDDRKRDEGKSDEGRMKDNDHKRDDNRRDRSNGWKDRKGGIFDDVSVENFLRRFVFSSKSDGNGMSLFDVSSFIDGVAKYYAVELNKFISSHNSGIENSVKIPSIDFSDKNVLELFKLIFQESKLFDEGEFDSALFLNREDNKIAIFVKPNDDYPKEYDRIYSPIIKYVQTNMGSDSTRKKDKGSKKDKNNKLVFKGFSR